MRPALEDSALRILVTGGAGYVGGFTARHLLARGHDVVALDDLREGHREALPAGTLHVGDIADPALLRDLLREQRIDSVIHFAASSCVGASVEDPRSYYRNNVAGSLALLEAMLDCGVSSIVFSSTCAVFGEAQRMPLDERAELRPENPYAFSKLATERMIRDFSRAHGLRFALLRYFNAAGAAADGSHGEDHRPETHLIPLVLQTLLGQRDELRVFGDDYPTPDGTCIRDYVHVDDLAQAHELALHWIEESQSHGGDDFNLGTGSGHSVLEVIRSVERVTGKQVRFEVAGRRPGDTPRLVALPDKARQVLDWQPRHGDLDGIVASAWAWHEAHPRGYGS